MLIGTLLTGAPALRADAKKPDGTVTIDDTQFGFIIGGSTGGGTLTYKGKEHPLM